MLITKHAASINPLFDSEDIIERRQRCYSCTIVVFIIHVVHT